MVLFLSFLLVHCRSVGLSLFRLAAIDSPRKVVSPRPMDVVDDGFSCHMEDSTCTCGSRTPYWPSQESRDMDYGCGDTTSVSECHDSFNDGEIFPK